MTNPAGGGPQTEEGKEVARWNSTRHGIRSPAPVVPGVEKQEDWEEYREGMLEDLAPLGSLELVRECLYLIASAAGEDLEESMEGARTKARLDVISAKHEAERVEAELSNMRRERLLPDDKTLEKVSRYEAHLSRLMFKALHELEALQVRRSGGAAPLARLDVDGLAAD